MMFITEYIAFSKYQDKEYFRDAINLLIVKNLYTKVNIDF